jgi:hypothetical protein
LLGFKLLLEISGLSELPITTGSTISSLLTDEPHKSLNKGACTRAGSILLKTLVTEV